MPKHPVRAGESIFDFELVELSASGLFMIVGRDTANEERLRSHLAELEKLGTVGRMVSGVAHELNSPLASIVGYSQLLETAKLDASTKQIVEVLRAQAERAGRIVENFLNVATKAQSRKRHFDVNEVVNKVLKLREYDQKIHDIVARTELSEEPLPALGDSGQIEQVVFNLVTNAEDAVASVQGRSPEILIRTSVSAGKVQVVVIDNGGGIRSADMRHIFDPFFTTKAETESNGGTGLGLNICAEIVKDHDGQLYARSRYGRGSEFTLELPIAVGAHGPEPDTDDMGSGEALRGRSIIVIDDEVTIAELMEDFLGRFGATLEFCSSGAEGFERICQNSYDVIVCDQRMPGLNGQSLFKMIQSVNPELAQRFIFVTGDVLNERTQQFFRQTGVRYLTKPFRLRDLLSAIESVL
jgi:nitrogen-specific signal transduction histidine kinase